MPVLCERERNCAWSGRVTTADGGGLHLSSGLERGSVVVVGFFTGRLVDFHQHLRDAVTVDLVDGKSVVFPVHHFPALGDKAELVVLKRGTGPELKWVYKAIVTFTGIRISVSVFPS